MSNSETATAKLRASTTAMKICSWRNVAFSIESARIEKSAVRRGLVRGIKPYLVGSH